MKKITFLALHLGYGGIEKCIANVSDMLAYDYKIEIVSLYKIYEEPKFKINKRVKITYLLDTDLPLRMSKYMTSLKKLKFNEIFKNLNQEYVKEKEIKNLFKDVFGSFYTFGFKRNKALANFLKNHKSDYYITTHMFMNKICDNHANGHVIGWEHNHHHDNINYINNFKNACKYIDEVIVVNNNLRKFYKKEFDISNVNCKVKYIPNFIDDIPRTKSKLNTLNLLYVGRLSPEKGVLDLIDVINLVVKENKQIVLNLVGDGPQYEEVKLKIEKYNLEDNIIMHGFLSRKEINELTKQTTLFILPSHTESFGLVLLEAMCMKVPCIAFDSAEGAKDLIKNKFNGFLIKNRDINNMAIKILETISNKDLLEEMGKNCLEFVEEFNEINNRKEWEKLLNDKKYQ